MVYPHTNYNKGFAKEAIGVGVYLFIGEDSSPKDIQLRAIRKEFLKKETKEFNLDILYGKGLALKDLQERLSYLPVNNPRRLVVIKEAQNLREDAKSFILNYVKAPHKQIVLVLDIDQQDKSEEFINQLNRYSKTWHFEQKKPPDTFSLSRQLTLKRPEYALRVLNQLLTAGERPERILGGLRYSLERDIVSQPEMKRRLRLLLNCDIDIKTGRIKPIFALERLVIKLCGLGKPFH